jgi:multidrug transporter EmrE-like cation transporter
MLSAILPILLSVLLGVAGQLLLKYGVGTLGQLDIATGRILQTAWRVATTPGIIGGVLCYGLSMVFWIYALSKVDLSFAYPFVSLSQLLILFSSWLLFREKVDLSRFIGVMVIAVGVLLVARSGR